MNQQIKRKNIFKFLTILLTTITQSAAAEKTIPTHFVQELTTVRRENSGNSTSNRIINDLQDYQNTINAQTKDANGKSCEPTPAGRQAIKETRNKLKERLDENCSNIKYTVLQIADLFVKEPTDSDLRPFYNTVLLLTIPQCRRPRY